MTKTRLRRITVALLLVVVFLACWAVHSFLWGVLYGSIPAALISSIAPFYFGFVLLIAGHSLLLALVSLLAAIPLPVLFVAAIIKPDYFILPSLCILATLMYFTWGFVLISIGV